jgi:tRNA threonylcarbamoyl adenosine modification protein YeaZ
LQLIALAIDTAGTNCAVCVISGAERTIMAEKCEAIGKGHAERLMGMVSEVLADAAVVPGNLDRIIAAIGPGSFTGIRVGVAAARGFSLGLDIPIVGVSNLEAMLANGGTDLSDQHALGAVLTAGRGSYYCLFNCDCERAKAHSPFLASGAEIAKMVQNIKTMRLCGTGAEELIGEYQIEADFIGASEQSLISTIARLGMDKNPDTSPPRPLYLREADAIRSVGFAVERVS